MALGLSSLTRLRTGGRSSRREGCAEAEELAEAAPGSSLAEAAPGSSLAEADADELAEVTGGGPELTVRFTPVPCLTGVPASMPCALILPAATLSLGSEPT